MSNGVEFSQQELDEFLAAVFGHNGEAIDNDESVQTLLQLDFELLLEICRESMLERGTHAKKSRAPRGVPEKSISSSSSSWKSCSVRVSKLGAMLGGLEATAVD